MEDPWLALPCPPPCPSPPPPPLQWPRGAVDCSRQLLVHEELVKSWAAKSSPQAVQAHSKAAMVQVSGWDLKTYLIHYTIIYN